jgi:hypothetical protein
VGQSDFHTAMEAKISDHVWSIEELCGLLPEAASATKGIDKGLILKALGAQAKRLFHLLNLRSQFLQIFRAYLNPQFEVWLSFASDFDVSLDALHVAAMTLLLRLRHGSASVQPSIIDCGNQTDPLPVFLGTRY